MARNRFLALVTVAGALAACTAAPARRASPSVVTSAAETTSAATTTTTATTPATVPQPLPPFPVATVTIHFVDSSRPTVTGGVRISTSRTLTTYVWFPSIGGRWPLVVFAPGFRVGPDTYADLLRTWAAAGYVVAAPEFPLADPAVAGAAVDEGDLDNEPSDVTFVIASLIEPSSPVAAQIEPSRIAVAGHSDGAEVALAVAQDGVAGIKAAIAMSAQPVAPRYAPNPALLVIQGDQDTINPPARALAVYQQAASPRFLLTLLGAGHLPPFTGGSRWTAVVDAVTVDFLNAYLGVTTPSDGQMHADANRSGLSDLK